MSSEIAYPTAFVEAVQPIPAAIDQASLNANGLTVVSGLTEDLAKQLVEVSKQPHIGKFCANDPGTRFGDFDLVGEWQDKGRLALPLVRGAGSSALELAGMLWMGPGSPGKDELTLPGFDITFALRIYASALGQGNAAPYVKAGVAAHGILHDNEGVWLETWGDNEKAIAAYRAANFKDQGVLLGDRGDERVWRKYMVL